MRPFLVLALSLVSGPLSGQQPYVAPNAPRDRPIVAFSNDGASKVDSLIQPLILQARATYPEARRRYLAGLPPQHGFFVTASLSDAAGHREVVFIGVDSLAQDSIFGRIANDLLMVQGYRNRQPYAMPEADILDWLITRPDGTEDGNVVGKFLDTLKQ